MLVCLRYIRYISLPANLIFRFMKEDLSTRVLNVKAFRHSDKVSCYIATTLTM